MGATLRFIEPLRKAAESFILGGGSKESLTLVRSKSYSTDHYNAEIEKTESIRFCGDCAY